MINHTILMKLQTTTVFQSLHFTFTFFTHFVSMFMFNVLPYYYVNSVPVRSFSAPYFPAFGLNTSQKNSEYGHFFCIVFHYSEPVSNDCKIQEPVALKGKLKWNWSIACLLYNKDMLVLLRNTPWTKLSINICLEKTTLVETRAH